MINKIKTYGFFCLGLALLLLYWYWVHPPGFARGYAEDLCPDIVRQIMAQQLQKLGRPSFITDQVMTPFKVSVPYLSWAIERDWLGAYVWMWDRDFPFIWVYFGVSLITSYLGVGFILRRMRLSSSAAWLVALAVVGFHVPRHFKIWHHHEHLLQHWVYWGIFIDAWIWQKYLRDRNWSWSLELWRGFCLLGLFGTVGYFWGPMLLEWSLVRVGLVLGAWVAYRRGERIKVEGSILSALFPVSMGILFLLIDFRWFSPLFKEVKRLGEVYQGVSWFAHGGFLIRPLWLDTFKLSMIHWPPIDAVETVSTIGWFYLIPMVLALRLLRKKRGGLGLWSLWPFLILMGIAVFYMSIDISIAGHEHIFQTAVQTVVPFMKFFRVASRWSLFMPQFTTVLVVLAWPELSRWVMGWLPNWRENKKKLVFLGFYCFVVGSEVTWLGYPVNAMAPLSESVQTMLNRIRDLPGTSVLNMPFCVAGGNGVCTAEQCPNYPYSNAPACLRTWHDKKVYGLYASRLLFSDCEYYNRQPYRSWFNAWGTQRCLTEPEWNDFCEYLNQHTELSAVLVFPGIWHGAATPECRAEFDNRLGQPLGEDSFYLSPTRGGGPANPTGILWYGARCRQ